MKHEPLQKTFGSLGLTFLSVNRSSVKMPANGRDENPLSCKMIMSIQEAFKQTARDLQAVKNAADNSVKWTNEEKTNGKLDEDNMKRERSSSSIKGFR